MGSDDLTRRSVLQGLITALAPVAVSRSARAAQVTSGDATPYSPAVLPPGIRSRFVNNINGLRMHVLEAGFETPGRPAVLLLHGFPELAYSWRKVMLPIAAAGYPRHRARPARLRAHVRAPTSATTTTSRRSARSTRSATSLGLVSAFGYRSVAAVVGHDFRLAARGLVRAGAARRLPLGGDDERAVRRAAGAAVQHRRCAPSRRHPARAPTRSTTSWRR